MDILDYTSEELKEYLIQNEFEKYRAGQIFQWIYQKFVFDFDEMTNISKKRRDELKKLFTFKEPLFDVEIHSSSDGTEKLQFVTNDESSVEAVIIPEKDRNTLCISTQIGCPLSCTFCRTGSLGFKRNLTPGEIVWQVLYCQKYLMDKGRRVTNVVYMGMGEPLLNFESTMKSISILKDDMGMNFSNRKITVSTAGISDKIVEMGHREKVNLALSLHSPNDAVRTKIMPVTKKYPLKDLIETIKIYPISPRKRVLLEYVMLKGVNDSRKDAKELVKIAHYLNAKVNLIPFNIFEGCGFESTPMDEILAFQEYLASKNVTTLLRKSRGEDSLAACGQLGYVKTQEDSV